MFPVLDRIVSYKTISAASNLFDNDIFDNYELVRAMLVDARGSIGQSISVRDMGALLTSNTKTRMPLFGWSNSLYRSCAGCWMILTTSPIYTFPARPPSPAAASA